MFMLLALLLILVIFGVGFSTHFLWLVGAIVLFAWFVGVARGRGSAGRHHFYRW